MRALLTGLGAWGSLWYEKLLLRDDIVLAGAVDLNRNTWKAEASVRFFADAEQAMELVKPDFVLNATPPKMHRLINDLAFDRDIPVLCEKPIAENHEDVLHIASRALKGQKMMIAENYRYAPQARAFKAALGREPVGVIQEIHILFKRRHHIGNYHMSMKHPLLLDVGIHHLDMLRYFTGSEAKRVNAGFHTPPGSWYRGYSNAELLITMQDGLKVTYVGSLDAEANETGWYGQWTFTGENGELCFAPDDREDNAGSDAVLDSFIDYVRNGKMPETHISDNIKTQSIANAALQSFHERKEITLDAD